MPFYWGKRFAHICVVLAPKNRQRIPANTLSIFSSPDLASARILVFLAMKDDSDTPSLKEASQLPIHP
jgi:hypothetical protein